MRSITIDLKPIPKLDINIGGIPKIDISIDNAKISPVIGDVEQYDGSYVVTPKTEQQTLNTARKYLTNNVTVHKIPFYEVSNTSGGSTVFIGMEVLVDG